MFRSANGKFLRHMFEHPVVHDLSSYSSYEKGLIFLLMSITGGSTSAEAGYSFNGPMCAQFRDPSAAIADLRNRGYLNDALPFSALVDNMTVQHLKELLRTHELPVSGKRADLIERLAPVVTDADLVDLRKAHDCWYPSALGFEMIYSLYDLWERRQLALMDALAADNHDAICAAYQHMPYIIGFWDDSAHNYAPDAKKLSDVRGVSNTAAALWYLCGFSPEFNIRNTSGLDNNFEEAVLQIHRNARGRELREYRAQGVKKIEWHGCRSCHECADRDGKVYPIDKVPICPVGPGCYCHLSPVYDDDFFRVRIPPKKKQPVGCATLALCMCCLIALLIWFCL